MTTAEKLNWIKNDFIDFLKTLPSHVKGKWGVMNAQEMVEHMSDSTKQGNGKKFKKLLTPEEHLEKYRSFMLSDKPFKENTKNPGVGEKPVPLIKGNMKEAIEELQNEFNDLFTYYKDDNAKEVVNEIFGSLNYDQWVHLLHKHSRHHARQFGLIAE